MVENVGRKETIVDMILRQEVTELKKEIVELREDIAELMDDVEWTDAETHPKYDCKVWALVDYGKSRMRWRADYDAESKKFIFPSFALIRAVGVIGWKPRHISCPSSEDMVIPMGQLLGENDEIPSNIPWSPEVSKPRFPMSRMLRENDFGPYCPGCKSSLKLKWYWWFPIWMFRTDKCVHKDCENYYDATSVEGVSDGND